ncbi:MAG: flagellar hook-associated protein FlgL [Firmicutes bacterium]|nr:flagellar hook-associated protein FlgL [Bacillota bacterium]
MRITNTMITNRMVTTLNGNLTNLDNYYTQMSTSKKIQLPSDDPIIASRALKYRTTVSDTTQYRANVKQASSWIEITESTFRNIDSIYQRMREICVQGSTDTCKDDDRTKLLDEFDSLVEQLEDEMNVTYMGRYIFSGYKTDTPVMIKGEDGINKLNPDVYEKDAGGNYIIDSQKIKIEIGVGTYADINSTANNVYTQDIYDKLHAMRNYVNDDMSQDALMTLQDTIGDSASVIDLRSAMDAMIGKLDEIMADTMVEHTRVGVKINRLELTENRLAEDYTNYKALMSDNEDVNLAEAAMNYNTANAVYNAALKVGMGIAQVSLVDYL